MSSLLNSPPLSTKNFLGDPKIYTKILKTCSMISSFPFASLTHDALNYVRQSIICKTHTFGLLFHSFKPKATVSLKFFG